MDKIIFNSQLSMPGISTHDLIYASYDFEINTLIDNVCSYSFIRDFRNINVYDLHACSNELNWNAIYSLNDIDCIVDVFNANILYLLDKFAPLRKKADKKFRNDFKFSDKLIYLANIRDFYFTIWKRSRDVSDRINYVKARNTFNNNLYRERKSFEESKFNPQLPNKILFQRLRNTGIIGRKNNSSNSFSPDDFNDSFSSGFSTNADFTVTPNFDGFSFVNIVEEDIIRAFDSVRSNAVGLDGISIKCLRILLPAIVPFIKYIINTCITKSVFPKCWKISRVFPLQKKTRPSIITDYRPISVLPSLSKVFEHIIEDQINLHISTNNYLDKFQSGFRKFHSTSSA
jgi:hypothetical protein